jgi:hypothetical protein
MRLQDVKRNNHNTAPRNYDVTACDMQHCRAVLGTELKINYTFLLLISSVSFRGKSCISVTPTPHCIVMARLMHQCSNYWLSH